MWEEYNFVISTTKWYLTHKITLKELCVHVEKIMYIHHEVFSYDDLPYMNIISPSHYVLSLNGGRTIWWGELSIIT
jgi:hypothetical protein